MKRIYRIFHYLSLDIVLGAVAMSFFVSQLMKARPGWSWYVALGSSVWLLYMGDHLLDAWRHRKKGLRDMHQFLFTNRKGILYFLGIVLILDMFLVFNVMSTEILKVALFLAILVLMFYAMRHIFRRNSILSIPGEIFVLLFYLAGVSLGGAVFRTVEVGTTHMMVFMMMFAVLLMNLGVISLYDASLDTRLGIASLAILLGAAGCRIMVLFSGMVTLLLSLLQTLIFGNNEVARLTYILSGMALILLMILYQPNTFRKNEAYRLAADAVLYLAFLSILV